MVFLEVYWNSNCKIISTIFNIDISERPIKSSFYINSFFKISGFWNTTPCTFGVHHLFYLVNSFVVMVGFIVMKLAIVLISFPKISQIRLNCSLLRVPTIARGQTIKVKLSLIKFFVVRKKCRQGPFFQLRILSENYKICRYDQRFIRDQFWLHWLKNWSSFQKESFFPGIISP